MNVFEHDRLDVYRIALEFVEVAEEVAAHLPRGRAYLADPLRSVASLIPLRIAEGAGEACTNDKARCFRLACRSATECAATLDVCDATNLADSELLFLARNLLQRIVSNLTAMMVHLHESELRAA
jgi:four helix bundle protein